MNRKPTYEELEMRISLLEEEAIRGEQIAEGLRERVKELHCLYSIADFIGSTDSLEELLQKTVNSLPQGWYYPKHACARIIWKGQEFKTANFQETEWILSTEIIVRGGPHGAVELRYLKEMPNRDEGPFLKEERHLLNAIAERLGSVIERKQIARKSQDTLNFLSTLLNTISSPIFYKDTAGIYRGCNKAFANFMGRTREEIVGKSVYELSPKDLADKYQEMDASLFSQQGTQVYEHQVMYADGSKHDVIFNKATYLNADGIIEGLVGVVVDITERKQAENARKASEAQVRLLLNSTAEAIYGIDLQGNCTFANPSCLRMLGYAEMEQMLGKNMHNLIHHSYPGGSPMAVEVCRIYQAFRVGKGVHVDDEVLWRADGSSFPVEYWSYPQIENGVVNGAVVTFIDITKRKQAEEEKEKLISALEKALSEVKKLGGLLPICASCKMIRNDEGYWEQIEVYIRDRSEADFSHSICPACTRKLYPELLKKK